MKVSSCSICPFLGADGRRSRCNLSNLVDHNSIVNAAGWHPPPMCPLHKGPVTVELQEVPLPEPTKPVKPNCTCGAGPEMKLGHASYCGGRKPLPVDPEKVRKAFDEFKKTLPPEDDE